MIALTDFAERALKRITPMYEDSEFIQEFFNGISFDDVRAYFKTLREQSFIPTVDWAIETQEHKYSLEPRPDLTLEQRRARLGIKAAVHRPLNPKILEQAIKDYYGFDTYLYEKKAGYIILCANYMTEDGFKSVVEFLETEKPAHLTLGAHFHIVIYPGDGGGEDSDIGDPIYTPEEDPNPIPDDIKKYPRLFVGNGQIVTGEVGIEPARPTNELIRARVATAEFVQGEVEIIPAAVKGAVAFARAGIGIGISGDVSISTQKVLIPYSPNLPVIYPPDSPIIIPPDNPYDPIVDPEYKPPADPEIQEYYFLENPTANLAIADKVIARGAENFIKPIDDIDSIEFDSVKLFFDFPISRHRRVRGVSMSNARDDLTEKEIQAVGQYAVDNKLITNTAGELASAVTKAALKTRETTRIF